MPVLTGRVIRLEPVTLEHAAGYLAAAGTGADAEEVFRWLRARVGAGAPPRGRAEPTSSSALAARATW